MPNSLPKKVKPVNRHLLIFPHFKEEEKDDAGILLPEDYKPKEERYITATLVDVAPDCAPHFRSLSRERKEVIVDRGMIEEITYKDKKFFLILENYVVGILREFSED